MDINGQIHKELMTNTITVIDFGAGTTIPDTFKNLKRLQDKSETYYEGMNNIFRVITRRIERLYGVKRLNPLLVEQGFLNGTLIAKISQPGGINIVANKFKKSFNENECLIVENPQLENINGFYKLATTIVNNKIAS